jgi:NAD(P)H-dependent FMN reductase
VTRIIGISGSLRAASLNSALLRAAAASAPEGVEIEIASIHGIPLYNEDLERTDFPAAVSALKEKLKAADGLLLVTPEYNHSMPGVLTNAVDWISRPAADIPQVLRGLPVAIIGASPGGFGTVLAQTAWLQVIRTLGLRPWFGMSFTLSHATGAFGPDGTLVDAATRDRLQRFIAGFAEFVVQAGRVPRRRAGFPAAIARAG